MIYNKMNRRFFLQGSSGFALALPFLPSLMNRAEAAVLPSHRFLVAKWNGHGGIHPDNLYPIRSTVSQQLQNQVIYPAAGSTPQHSVAFGNLVNMKRTYTETASAREQSITDYDNGQARVSPIIGSYIPDSILNQMNLVYGVDMPFYGGHTRGFLGNYANRDGGPYEGMSQEVPTIDYVIGNSTKFYPVGDTRRVPSLMIGHEERLSNYPSGPNPEHSSDARSVYGKLFTGVTSTGSSGSDPDASLVNLIFEDFSRLARGTMGAGRRIGRDDRSRLESYMQGLSDVEARMRAVTVGCSVPPQPGTGSATYTRDGENQWDWSGTPAVSVTDAEQRAAMELYNLLIVQAFLCGTTRIVVHSLPGLKHQYIVGTFPAVQGNTPGVLDRTDPHGTVYHEHLQRGQQQYMIDSQRFIFRYGVVDLIEKMAAADIGNGNSLLDQSLVYFSQESGPWTHDTMGVPCVMAGGAGGFFRTGMFVDVRNMARGMAGKWSGHVSFYAGLPQNRWLATICRAMGLAPSDYERSYSNHSSIARGYGDPWQDREYGHVLNGQKQLTGFFPAASVADMSVPFPIITG